MATPKQWKPRTHTTQLAQRTQRRLLTLNSVSETAPRLLDAIENPDVREHAERLLGKLHRLCGIYGPAEALGRFEVALDRLLIGGVQ